LMQHCVNTVAVVFCVAVDKKLMLYQERSTGFR